MKTNRILWQTALTYQVMRCLPRWWCSHGLDNRCDKVLSLPISHWKGIVVSPNVHASCLWICMAILFFLSVKNVLMKNSPTYAKYLIHPANSKLHENNCACSSLRHKKIVSTNGTQFPITKIKGSTIKHSWIHFQQRFKFDHGVKCNPCKFSHENVWVHCDTKVPATEMGPAK